MTDETMSEGKAKKPGLLRRILRWLWVILLTALLALGFVFAAPWKVITLIAIFLAGATILPRVYRKWFWLGVGIVVLAIIAWIFLPDNNKDWRPYQFDKELAQLQAKYAVPDSENAAIAYNKILADWKQKEANEPNLPDCWFDNVRKGPWSSKDQPEIAAYIKYHQNEIESVLQATKIEKCSFPVVAKLEDYGKDTGRLPAIRHWAYLLVASGNNDLGEGKPKEASEKYLALLRGGQHLSGQPNSLYMLIGIAIEALGLGAINNFVVNQDANELYLNQIEQSVSQVKHDWNNDLPGFIDTDKLKFKNMVSELFYEINQKGKVRFSHDPMAKIRESAKELLADTNSAKADIFSDYWFKKLFKAYAILYWFYMPQTPEKMGKIVDAEFKNNYTLTDANFDWSKEPQAIPIESLFKYKMNFHNHVKILAQMNLKTYFNLHDIYLETQAKQRGTLLIIALRHYKNANGHWPEKLEDMNNLVPADTFIDSVNCGTFVYRRTGDSFMLYSRGKNNIDEDGEYETKNIKNYPYVETIKDDKIIWPYKSKSSIQQEVKADANEGAIK
ncbi:MAG: hypothetical protein ABSH16_03220 [Sedimentisphaerales bacterium]